jgi:[acyl-carrier-protein] S-malonyltransferase
MEAANREFADAIPELASVRCPVVQNLDAKPHDDPRQLRDNLARQMTAPVLWSRSVETMLEMGVEVFVEIGSGKVLGGLIRKIDRSAKVLNVSDPASLEETVGELRSLTSSPA